MDRPRISVTGLMVSPLVLAVNHAGFRLAGEWAGTGDLGLYSLTTAVPMVSLLSGGLILLAASLSQGRKVSSFLIGFEATGFAVLACALACVVWRRDWVDSYVTSVMPPFFPILDWVGTKLSLSRDPKVWENTWRVTGSILQTIPQLLLAIIGGLINTRRHAPQVPGEAIPLRVSSPLA